MGLRLTESIDGQATEVDRTVVGLKASLGFVDQRPTAGTFDLNLSGALMTDVPFDVTSATASPPAGYTVEDVPGGFIISKDDGGSATVSAENVDLDPISFVEIREFQQNGDYKYEVRLVQAPLASTSSFLSIVPPAPSIESIQVGGTDSGSGAAWNEIQALNLDPTFRGTYQLRRGYRKTSLLSIEDGIEEISAAINATLGVEGESFVVTNPSNNVAHIEFAGDAGGVAQDLLEVEVFSAPPGDPTFVLDLNKHDVFAALRGANEIKPQFEIELVLADENGGAEDFTVTVCRQEVKVIDEINKESNTTAQNVDWLREPSGLRYQPYGAGQIITGSQHYVATFGGSGSSYALNHNLGTQDVHVSVRNNVSGDVLEGADYSVTIDGDNSLTIDTASAPSTNGLAAVITSAGPTSAFQAHNHAIAEVTGLQTILDDLGLRLQVIEGLVPTGAISTSIANATGEIAKWKLPEIFEVYPKRGSALEAKKVSDIKPEDLPRKGARLLPAVFDAAPTYVSALPGSPVAGTVYCNSNVSDEITLPGYGGIRSRNVKPLGKFAWDGKGFYEVENAFDCGLHEFYAEEVVSNGTGDAVLNWAAEKPQLGENAVGMIKLTDLETEVPELADGWYPFKSDANGDSATLVAGSNITAATTSLSGYETVKVLGANQLSDISEAFISGGGTTMNFTSASAETPTVGMDEFFAVFPEITSIGLPAGAYKVFRSGSNNGTFILISSGLTDGGFTFDGVAMEHPGTIQTYDTVNSGEINRFYPVDFKRELFKVHVNDKQFKLDSILSLDFSLEMAAFLADTDVQWGILLQTGQMINDLKDTGNAGEGRELAGIRWNKPSLDQVVHLSDVVSTHNFGLKVYRSSSNVITCSSVEYGQEYGGAQAPTDANFVVRGLLHRFDIGELNGDEPTGLVAYSGLAVDSDTGGEAVITA